MTRAAGKSQWHWQMKGDNCGNKALPLRSNVSSDKKGGREVGDRGMVMIVAMAEDGGGRRQQHGR
jgi:hypothetical protein